MQSIEFNEETPVGQLAAEAPLSTRVFARHGIDFCCGGGVPLAEACATRGLDVDAVLADVRQELSSSTDSPESWVGAPLVDLMEHIVTTYHRPLDEELPRIDAMARKVHMVHGEKDPEQLGGIVETFAALKADLEEHLQKEEQILFPLIAQGHGSTTQGPVSVMHEEHETAGEMLRRLRELTNDYTVPEAACNTWRALWHALADLERALHEHIHLENNILFPRALSS